MSSTHRKLVLFDCDGTLVDSQVGIVTSMTRAFEASGLPPPRRDEVLGIIGLSLPIAIARLASHHPEAPVGAIVDAYKTAFFAHRTEQPNADPLFPGARAVLDALVLRDDLTLGVVTGKSRRGLVAVLAGHGLSGAFAVLKTADDGPSKPDRGMVLDALDETGTAAADAVVIGDTTFDVEMGKAAGCAAIGVAWGYHPAEALRAAGADRLVARWEEIPAALDDLFGNPTHA